MSKGQWIQISRSEEQAFKGYLSLPPSGVGPGLLLLQEIWGVNDHIQQVADQYAADGFVVLAPDVFWRQQERVSLPYHAEGVKRAYDFYQGVNYEVTRDDLLESLYVLAQLPFLKGEIGVLGFCFGGRLAMNLVNEPKVSKVVSYYGSGILEHSDILNAACAQVLMHFAEKDHLIPLSDIQNIKDHLAKITDIQTYLYPESGHGFNCPYRGAFNVKASLLARSRTLDFLAGLAVK
jgi:carboxymethylenebutenolidase